MCFYPLPNPTSNKTQSAFVGITHYCRQGLTTRGDPQPLTNSYTEECMGCWCFHRPNLITVTILLLVTPLIGPLIKDKITLTYSAAFSFRKRSTQLALFMHPDI